MTIRVRLATPSLRGIAVGETLFIANKNNAATTVIGARTRKVFNPITSSDLIDKIMPEFLGSAKVTRRRRRFWLGIKKSAVRARRIAAAVVRRVPDHGDPQSKER